MHHIFEHTSHVSQQEGKKKEFFFSQNPLGLLEKLQKLSFIREIVQNFPPKIKSARVTKKTQLHLNLETSSCHKFSYDYLHIFRHYMHNIVPYALPE